MKPNFYETIIPLKNEKERNLLNEMNKLVDESMEMFINIRSRQINEKEKIESEPKEKKENILNDSSSQRNENNENNNNEENNNSNNVFSHLRYRFGREARLRRIMNMEEDNLFLDRLINNENVEIIG